MSYPEYRQHAADLFGGDWDATEMLVWESPYVGCVWETWRSLVDQEVYGIPVEFNSAVPSGTIVVDAATSTLVMVQ